jgi:hypothetical protein
MYLVPVREWTAYPLSANIAQTSENIVSDIAWNSTTGQLYGSLLDGQIATWTL